MNRIDDYHSSRRVREHGNFLAWLVMSVSIVLVISLLLPFPLSLLISFNAALMIDLFMARKITKRYHSAGSGLWTDTARAAYKDDLTRNSRNDKMGIRNKAKEFFASLSSSSYTASTGLSGYHYYYPPLRFYCMNCGREHKERACPKCGSKAVRVG